MPENKIQHAAPVPPFVRFVASAVPMVFDNSLSYYEALCALWKWMQDDVIDVINNNAAVTEHYIEMDEETRQLFIELKNYIDTYFDNLDVQEEINNKLDAMVESGEFQEILEEYLHKLDDYSDSNQISVGNNLLTDNSLWVLNSGWTTDGNGSFTHIVNQTADLVYNYNFAANKVYVLGFQINTSYPAGTDNAGNDFTVVIGDTKPIITYRGGGSMYYTIALKPTTSGTLSFKCVSHSDPYTTSGLFDGTISNITLKEATGELTQLAIKDGDGNDSLPFTILLDDNQTVAIGKNAATHNYNQTMNLFIGEDSGKNDVTGYFNVGIGGNTLKESINSSRNIAIGYSALRDMTSGDRNIGIGPFAMSANKYGRKNIAIGFDTMMGLTYGEDNLAIGNQCLNNITNGTKNQLAIGTLAMGGATYAGDGFNIGIGRAALYRPTTGYQNIAIGQTALYQLTTALNNIAIGANALNKNATANGLIGIGSDAGSKITGGGSSVVIGYQMGQSALTTMNRSVAIGTANLTAMVSLTNSCLLGYNIYANSEHTTIENVIAINNGKRSIQISKDNYINIGNTIFGDTTTNNQEKVGIGVDTPTARLHLPAGSSTAGTAPLKLTSGTLLGTKEDGVFEYDGTHLYFTIGSTRHTLV